jgi:hypothetical protein
MKRTETPQKCPAIAAPHSFLSFLLPSVYPEHMAHNAEGTLECSQNVLEPNILFQFSQ